MNTPTTTPPPPPPANPQRRLSDKILLAFDQACRQNDLDSADHLLRALDVALTREALQGKGADRRGELGPLTEAFSRLKELRAQALAAKSK
jgi:hypothetical protein